MLHKRALTPICKTGLSDRKAVAIPVMAFVQPGPAVVTTQPSFQFAWGNRLRRVLQFAHAYV
ncbi:MAG: hypothetical protein Ct9H300mP28_15330 [Pseudomonadota bacterium]|nr:MAG: hypothetical protein Ct9H300mP28_15330 [Pseudomonadota bacterium]